jgi:hypothetical protein
MDSGEGVVLGTRHRNLLTRLWKNIASSIERDGMASRVFANYLLWLAAIVIANFVPYIYSELYPKAPQASFAAPTFQVASLFDSRAFWAALFGAWLAITVVALTDKSGSSKDGARARHIISNIIDDVIVLCINAGTLLTISAFLGHITVAQWVGLFLNYAAIYFASKIKPGGVAEAT